MCETYVYSYETPMGGYLLDVELMKILIELSPKFTMTTQTFVGPHNYGRCGWNDIPDDIWEQYRALEDVTISDNPDWTYEMRKYYEGEKNSMAKSKKITVTLRGYQFPLDVMLRVSPEVRKYLKRIN